jgi:autotransporter translocation and assembly factor TamB
VLAELPWDLQRGTAAWEQGRLQARAEGLQLGALLDLFPFLEGLQGTLRVDLSVDGLAAVPRIHGGVEVADLRLRLLDTKPDYLFPTGRLVFDGSRGEFRDFVGRPAKGEGRIEVSGFVAAETATQLAYDVQVRAENLPYIYEDIFNAPDIDAEIALRSTPTGGLLKGSARLSRALAEPELIDLTAPSLPPPPAAVRNPFLEHMQLDVFVDVRDLRVKNELADLRLEGGVTAYGTFYKPRFQGGLEVTEGKAFVLNREFSFKKGRISLDRLVPTYSILDLAYDPLLLNPDLDLELGTTVKPIEETEGDYQVTLRLQGPVQEVAPEFSSEPSLGDTEILTLLAFGSTSPANYREALYTAAGQLLLSKQVEKIGLDEFQVLPSGTVLNTVGQPSVRLSKHFAFPVPLWVRYEAATAKPAFGELRLEYKLTSYLTLTGAAQSEYDRYGLGLGLKKDF